MRVVRVRDHVSVAISGDGYNGAGEVVSTAIRPPWSSRRKVAAAGGVAAGWVAVVGVIAAMAVLLGLRPTPGATASLDYALPAPSESGVFAGYDKFTAPELNRRKQGHELRVVRYVDAEKRSTGPAVVSVNPIDPFTWGAAALSDQNGACYVVVALADHDNTRFGTTKYGKLRPGARCVGANATPQTATRGDWPPTDSGGSWAALVLDVLLFAPLVLFAVILVVRARRQGRLGRSLVQMLLAAFLATVAWWAVLLSVSGALDQAWNEFGFSNYTRALVCAGVAGAIVEAATIGAMAPRRASLERRLGFAALGAFLLAIPVGVIIVASSII